MKKILKTIILFVIMFIGTISVKAIPTINYEFGKYVDYIGNQDGKILDIIETDTGYKMLGRYYSNDSYIILTILDKEFNHISSEEITEEYYYYNYAIFSDVVLLRYTKYVDDESIDFYDIYNEKLELIKTIEAGNSYSEYFSQIKGENDKYYMLGFDVFDKKTNELVDIEKIVLEGEYGEKIKNAINAEDFETAYSYILQAYEKEFSGTYIPLYSKILMSDDYETLQDWEILEATYENDKFAFTYYNDIENSFGLMVFNENAELIYNETASDRTLPKVMLDKNDFYIVEYIVEEFSSETESYPNVLGYFKITGYDYTGKEVLTKELSVSTSQYDREDNLLYDGRQLAYATLTDDGFYLVTNYYSIERAFNPNIKEEDTIYGVYPTFQKYYFIHPIETKTDGNGKIKVIENSRYGEKVSFVITPNEGYQIDIIKVTDADGNVLTFTDNTFTMPNANVTIEVSFIETVKNSETADIAIFSCIIIIILGVIGTIYSIKKLSWLK